MSDCRQMGQMNRYTSLNAFDRQRTARRRWFAQCLVACALLTPSVSALAYEGDIHQQLTFIAARQFNDCARMDEVLPRLSALDTRYIVRSNVAQAETGMFGRMFRWNYYNRADQGHRSFWGIIDTRFHGHFETLVASASESPTRERRLKTLGRILNYVQDVTSPSRVVPVYTGRWWRFSVSDRFDRFRLRAAEVAEAAADMCEQLREPQGTFQQVLEGAAQETMNAVRAPIAGFPATWEAYWRFSSDPDDFGDYGPAGNNFGERTQFRCGEQRCLLLEDDPLYREFATARHISAVRATMRAMALLQQAEVERLLSPAEQSLLLAPGPGAGEPSEVAD